jgi:hypothetical protein
MAAAAPASTAIPNIPGRIDFGISKLSGIKAALSGFA